MLFRSAQPEKSNLLSNLGWKLCETSRCAGDNEEGDELRRHAPEARLCSETRNKRIVSFHGPSDGPACCAWPGLCSQRRPDMDECRKRECKGQMTNIDVTRALIFPWTEVSVRLSCSHGWHFSSTNASFSSRNKILFIIAARKNKKKTST